jgi:hypothetical protein
MADKVDAEVRAASLEYRAIYQKPLIAQWGDGGKIKQATFEAFRDWGIALDHVSDTQFGTNLGQLGTTFQLLGKYNFRIGMSAATFSVYNPGWEEAAEIKKIVIRGTDAVKAASGILYSKHEVVLDIHLTPSGRSVSEITRPFVPSKLTNLITNDFVASGFTFQDSEKYWYVDASALFPGSIYLRIFRTFDASTSLDRMISSVHDDEVGLVDTIGLTVAGLG